MTSLFDLDDSSDSEDDFDYVPPANELSSEDEEPIPSSDDEKETKKKSRKLQKSTDSKIESCKKASEECQPETKTVDEKKKADDVYKSFLEEVAAEMKESGNESMPSNISCESTTSSPVVLNTEKTSCYSSAISTPEKLFDFAGETVSVVDGTVKSVEPDSSNISHPKLDNQAPASVNVATQPVKRKGLAAVLGTIQNKKQKITVLQKSMLDWTTFKKEENLGEELEKFNRGRGGFIERQRFLERSDLRSYEIERDMRLSKRPSHTKKTP